MLYADGGPEGQPVAIEAIGALVRVARPWSNCSLPLLLRDLDQTPSSTSQSRLVNLLIRSRKAGDFSMSGSQDDLPVEETPVEDEVQEVEFTQQVSRRR